MTNAGYEIVTIDPDGSSPLPLGAGGTLQLAALTVPPAQKLPVWAKSGDGDGGVLVRDPHYDLRVCTLQVRVRAASMDLALAAIGTLEGKLQEAEKVEDGMPVLWQPANSTKQLRLRMLMGQITDMPVTVADGWFIGAPLLTVEMTCKPFLYGAEVSGSPTTSTDPAFTITVASVGGDVPAEARLVLTDNSTQARRYAAWGLEQRHYNASTSLLIDSEDLVVTGFAGVLATRTGGYRRAGATHDTVSATLSQLPSALCGTGVLGHVGTFRVKARTWNTSPAEYFRLSWQSGDGSWVANDWVQPIASFTFNEIDLGVVTIEAAAAGAQAWSGRIEAYTTTIAGEVGEIDYLILYPCEEGFGQLSSSYAYTPGVLSGWDEFTGFGIGTVLNARTAPAGGAWATSGATTDFVGAGGVNVARSTAIAETGPRFAILGTTVSTNVEVSTNVLVGAAAGKRVGVTARWVDASNYVFAELEFNATPGIYPILRVGCVVAASGTVWASRTITTLAPVVFYQLRLICFASGRVLAAVLTSAGAGGLPGAGSVIYQLDTSQAVVATGGTLASGKTGLEDYSLDTVAATRSYGYCYVSIPAPEPTVINTSQSLEIRSNTNLREDVGGTKYGQIVGRGSRLFIPQAGDQNRTSRLVVRATRNDVTSQADTPLGDSLTAQAYVTPRYLAVPR